MKHRAIYEIRHVASGRVYIGSSVDVVARFSFHKWQLNHGSHACRYLQNAWSKYGSDSFTFAVLERPQSDSELIACEQKHLDRVWPAVFNSGKHVGRPCLGLKISASQKAAISARNKGHKWTFEQRRNLAAVIRAKGQSELQKKALDALHARNAGRKHAQATKDAMARAHTGKKKNMSDDWRAKIIASRPAVAEKLRGRVFSPETLQRMSVAQLKRFADKRRMAS